MKTRGLTPPGGSPRPSLKVELLRRMTGATRCWWCLQFAKEVKLLAVGFRAAWRATSKGLRAPCEKRFRKFVHLFVAISSGDRSIV